MQKTKKMKANSLVIDEKLTELRPINLYFVSRYRQAARNGAIFPPVVIEKGTNRVVSGNHRVTTFIQEFGQDCEVDVIEKEFATEADVIRTFAEENSKHGNPISGYTQKYITQKLLEYGDEPEEIAKALNIPVKKVQSLGGMNFVVIGKNKKKERKPMKRGLEHKAGSTIKESTYEEHRSHDRGVPARTNAEQLCRWVDNGWVDMSDKKTAESLYSLYTKLGSLFAEKATG